MNVLERKPTENGFIKIFPRKNPNLIYLPLMNKLLNSMVDVSMLFRGTLNKLLPRCGQVIMFITLRKSIQKFIQNNIIKKHEIST